MSPEFDICISVNAGEFPWSLIALSPKWSLDHVWKFHLGNNYSNALPPHQVSYQKLLQTQASANGCVWDLVKTPNGG